MSDPPEEAGDEDAAPVVVADIAPPGGDATEAAARLVEAMADAGGAGAADWVPEGTTEPGLDPKSLRLVEVTPAGLKLLD